MLQQGPAVIHPLPVYHLDGTYDCKTEIVASVPSALASD